MVSAKNADGHILYVRFSGGAALQAANKNFIEPQNSPREEARWKAALNELIEARLVDSVGYKGETFRVNKVGYDVADQIEAAKGKAAT